MSVAWIGVDVGTTGAVVLLLPDGEIEVFDMPVLQTNSKTMKQKYIDPHGIYQLFCDWKRDMDAAGIELKAMVEHTQSMPRESSRISFSMGVARGTVLTALALSMIPYEECQPTQWKRFHNLLKCDKEQSRSTAIRLFPQAADKLKRKLDHNRAEAMLIAAYAKVKK